VDLLIFKRSVVHDRFTCYVGTKRFDWFVGRVECDDIASFIWLIASTLVVAQEHQHFPIHERATNDCFLFSRFVDDGTVGQRPTAELLFWPSVLMIMLEGLSLIFPRCTRRQSCLKSKQLVPFLLFLMGPAWSCRPRPTNSWTRLVLPLPFFWHEWMTGTDVLPERYLNYHEMHSANRVRFLRPEPSAYWTNPSSSMLLILKLYWRALAGRSQPLVVSF